MGLRGPAPTPTAIRVLEGNPGKRPLNALEPQPLNVAPDCPEYVQADPAALKEWDRLLPILSRMRVLTEADGNVLASLCIIHSQLLMNLEKIHQFNAASKTGIGGIMVITKSGSLQGNPLYYNLQACIEQELKLCRELGLTPAARSRLQIAKEPEQHQSGSTLDRNWKVC